MVDAILWRSLSEGRVHCRLCSHYCLIEPGQRGLCGVRENQDGVLKSLVGDRLASAGLDPVEKKPLYHFHPGSATFSFGTMGCNLSCSFCQNYALSQPPRQDGTVAGQTVEPAQIVAAARREGASSISYTYSEPTIFYELMKPVAELALAQGLKNIIVSNGFMSREALEDMAPLVQAANIDLKAHTEKFYQELCGARLAPVLDNLKRMKELGWWVETTTLVIPGWNDSDEELERIAAFIAEELDRDTPWHVSRFHPSYRLTDAPPTPVETLEKAWRIGKAKGLNYVYVGNVPGHDGNNTPCPGCDEIAVTRRGFQIVASTLKDGVCRCGAAVAGVGLETLNALSGR